VQGLNIGDNPPVIHVPLVVHWIECLYFCDERSDAKAEIQGAEGVALLNPASRRDDRRVRVEKNRRGPVAPLGPPSQSGQHLATSSHERLPIDSVESVAEIDLKKCELRLVVLFQDIPKRVSDDLNSPGTTHSKVLALEDRGNLVLPG